MNNFDLHSVFAGQEDVLRSELRASKQAGHPGVQGGGTEDHWLGLLSRRLPRRYAATRAIVVDSTGQRSQQIDAVIHDRQFSPQLWEWGDHLYVPAESVYAVIEIKPELTRETMTYAGEKIASVRHLRRTSASFGWAKGTMEARADYSPLGVILTAGCSWSPGFGEPFVRALRDIPAEGALDLGCALGCGSFEIPNGQAIEDRRTSEPNVALVTFLLVLLHRLQGLGTAPAIDYPAYMRWITSATTPPDGSPT